MVVRSVTLGVVLILLFTAVPSGGLSQPAQASSIARVATWTVALNGNPASSVTNVPGLLDLSANATGMQVDFPYATAAPGLFPTAGDFTLTFVITYKQVRSYGDGVVLLSEKGHGLAWIWGDSESGINAGLNGFHWTSVWQSPDAAVHGTPSHYIGEGPGPHTVALTLRGTNMTLTLDGSSTLSAVTAERPSQMWAGHPTLGQLAGLSNEGIAPVKNKVDAAGAVTQRWWGPKEKVWTTFSLGAVLVNTTTLPALALTLPVCSLGASATQVSASCCTAVPATAQPAAVPLTAGLSVGPASTSVSIDGDACLRAGEQGRSVAVNGTLRAGGTARIDLGDARLDYRAGLQDARLDLQVVKVAAPDVPTLPIPLPVVAPPVTLDGAAYTLLEVLQVAPQTGTAAVGTVASVQVEIKATTDDQKAAAGQQMTLLYWDGSQWIDTQEHVGGTIVGHGEPDLSVLSASSAADGATALVSHTSTYALAARPVPAAAGSAWGFAQWMLVLLGGLLVTNLILWSVNGAAWVRGRKPSQPKASKPPAR